MCVKHEDLQIFESRIQQNIMSNFHRLEVVGRAGETQLQVGENLNYIYLARLILTARGPSLYVRI